MTDEPPMDDALARIELNARGFRPDPILERAAALFDSDRAAWSQLPAAVKSQTDVYRDLRDHHRRAVEAGVITDRGPSAA